MLANKLLKIFKLLIDDVAASTAPREAVAVVKLDKVVEPSVVEAVTERFVKLEVEAFSVWILVVEEFVVDAKIFCE